MASSDTFLEEHHSCDKVEEQTLFLMEITIQSGGLPVFEQVQCW